MEAELVPYSLKRCREAFQMILDWAAYYNGDISGAFKSTTRLSKFCRLVVRENKILAVLYPDFDSVELGNIVKIHSVLSTEGVKARQTQVNMLSEYIDYLFLKEGFRKAVIECQESARLARKIAITVGFTEEGRARKEWPTRNGKWEDIYKYGLLRSEWRQANGA